LETPEKNLRGFRGRGERAGTAARLLGAAIIVAAVGTAVPHLAAALSPPPACGCDGRVQFDDKSSVLSSEATNALNQFVMQCQSAYQGRIVVTGRAGEESLQGQNLAKVRAQKVRDYLLSTGILVASITISFEYGIPVNPEMHNQTTIHAICR
jgi:hypothetical protein